MIDKDRLTHALLTLMEPGSSEEPYDDPSGNWTIGLDLDTPSWAKLSAQGVAERLIEAYDEVAG